MFLKNNKWALLWALLIFILCAIPGKDIPPVSILEIAGIDKLIHAFMFFVLEVLLIKGFMKQENNSLLGSFPILISAILSVVYGGSLEIMQGAFYVDRTADIYDFIANSFGTIMGVAYFKLRH
jgi:VanZ family protein